MWPLPRGLVGLDRWGEEGFPLFTPPFAVASGKPAVFLVPFPFLSTNG